MHANMLCLRTSVEVLRNETFSVLNFLLEVLGLWCLTVDEAVEDWKDQWRRLCKSHPHSISRGWSKAVFGLVENALARGQIVGDSFIDIHASLPRIGVGVPREYQSVETAGTEEIVVQLLENVAVTITALHVLGNVYCNSYGD